MLDSSKAIQKAIFLLSYLKKTDLFAEITCKYFNESLENSKFPDCIKLANVTPVFKKVDVPQKIIIEQLAFCQFCLNYLKD